MDFMQRGSHQVQPDTDSASSPSSQSSSGRGKGRVKKVTPMKAINLVMLFSISILLVAVLASLITGGSRKESRLVDTDKLQAVFLNGGQVYFGDITAINDRFMRLNNIYYLRVNQTVQPDEQKNNQNSDVSLVKLGCELHGPEDQMVIYRDQVIFWENLKTDGQVSKAVAEYVKANPNGQQCTTNNTNSSSNNSGSETPAPAEGQ